MTSLERPKNWRDLAAGFVLNNLSDEEAMLWQTLCAQEPDLEQEARQMQQTFNQFADIIPLQGPSQSLIDAIRRTAQNPLSGTDDHRSPSLSQVQQGSKTFSVQGRSRLSLAKWFGGMVGLGAIAYLGIQVYGLNSQVQQLNQHLNDQQQQLQTAHTQMADIHRQLEQSTSQLTTVEEALAQSQSREEAMHQLLQELTQESGGVSRP